MTTLRISITKEVLEATKDCLAHVSENCAIAYAIRRIWPRAAVGLGQIHPQGNWLSFFPHNQTDFIQTFDSATPAERAAMQPFSFEIQVPDEVINEINIELIRRICDGSKTLEVV